MSWINNIQTAQWDGRKQIDLRVLNISTLNVNNISSGILNSSTINTNTLSVAQLFVSSFNNLPSSFGAENWSYYPAIHDVSARLSAFGNPVYNLSNFNKISGEQLKAPLGNITEINTSKIECGSGFGEINLYGADLVAGDNALYVEGGTTLSGGGLVHGVSIGALTVAGINTQRIDVLPVGISVITPTFLTMDAGGFANLAAGGAVSVAAGGAVSVAAGGSLSLAGGSYIEYNTDQNYFVNTAAGNDYTDIFVGNIHGANFGNQPLHINEGRGVEIENVKKIDLEPYTVDLWNCNTVYQPDAIVLNNSNRYVSYLESRSVEPNSNYRIPAWQSNIDVFIAQYVSSSTTFKCISTLTSNLNVIAPSYTNILSNLSSVWLPVSSISSINQFWGLLAPPTASYISGDTYSYARVGSISSISISTATQTANSITVRSDDNLGSIQFNDVDTPFASIGDAGGGQFYVASLNNMFVLANTSLNVGASNIAIGASEQLTLTSSNCTVLSSNIFIGAEETIDIIAPIVTINSLYTSNVSTTSVMAYQVTACNTLYTNYIGNPNPFSNTPIGINNTLDLQNNVIRNVQSITATNGYFSNLYFSAETASNDLNMNGYNINNVHTLNSSNVSTISVMAYQVTACNTLYTKYIGNPNPLSNEPIGINNTLDLQNNVIRNVQSISATSGYFSNLYFTSFSASNDLEMNGYNINNTNQIYVTNTSTDLISPLTGSKVTVSGGFDLDNNDIININSLYSFDTYTDKLHTNTTGSIELQNDMALNNKDLTNYNFMSGAFHFVSTMAVAQAGYDSTAFGYVGAGVQFAQNAGDDVFWQFVKPIISYTSPQGTEGIHIVQRTTIDGSMINMGRIYDDAIYTPWQNVTSNLNMNTFNISNVTDVETLTIHTSTITTNTMEYDGYLQPFIQYGSNNTDGGLVTVTLPRPYKNSNYAVSITYSQNPTGNQPPYFQDRTTSNFKFHGATYTNVMWVTYGEI